MSTKKRWRYRSVLYFLAHAVGVYDLHWESAGILRPADSQYNKCLFINTSIYNSSCFPFLVPGGDSGKMCGKEARGS